MAHALVNGISAKSSVQRFEIGHPKAAGWRPIQQ
jgi:hypothetical protein